jgi:hypothetical protein
MCKIVPTVTVVLSYIVFIVIGVASLAEDDGLRTESCGQNTHVFKYGFLNTVFTLFCLVTYFVFPGGGEGARARAVLMTIFHFGFAAWGILLWTHMSETCQQVMTNQFGAIHRFFSLCVVHNTLFGTALFIHEAFLGDYLGMDLTIIAEIRKEQAGPMGYPHEFHSLPQQAPIQTPMPPTKVAPPVNTNLNTGPPPAQVQAPSQDPPPELNLHTD